MASIFSISMNHWIILIAEFDQSIRISRLTSSAS